MTTAESLEEALKDEYHLLRAQLAEREEAAFRAGYRYWPDHGEYEDEAFAAWRASQKGTPT